LPTSGAAMTLGVAIVIAGTNAAPAMNDTSTIFNDAR